MYDNENITYRVGINWKDIIIKIIMFALFIFLLVVLFPKPNLDVFYDTVYTNNIKTMKEAARNYYTVDKLPTNVGDKTSMTLKEMIDNKMLIRFTDKDGKTCDETSSKVEVTKLSDSEYSLKVQLNCGDQNDYILETIGCTNICSNGTCTTVINNGSNNTIANNQENQDPATERVDHDEPTEGSVKDNDYKVTITLYQHRKLITNTKTVYTCPEGYEKNGTKCIKTTNGATIDATPQYNPDQVITTDAKLSEGKEHIVKTSPIKTEVGTDYSCPSGYTLNGSYCIKYTSATEHKGDITYSCPSGYTRNGATCTKTYTATYHSGTTSYSCPNGGTLNGSTCTLTTSGTPKTTYTCPAGYTPNGSSCYKVYTATANTSYTCPSGWTPSGSKCTRTTTDTKDGTPNTTYGSWVNKGTQYYTSSSKAYTGTTSKLVLEGAVSGATCGSPCGNKGIWYKYIYYTRTSNTTYTCPSGYSPSGSKCVKSVTETKDGTPNTTYTCPSGGTLNGTSCTLTANGTPNTTYTCPSGYTLSGSNCIKTYSATPSTGNGYYTCPSGGTLNGSTCTITTNATPSQGQTTYSCPTGYTYNESLKKCEYKISATATKRYSYSCPAGYTASGEGENMTCSKVVKDEGQYYCEDAEAKLEGTKCIKTVKGGIKGYTCPADYTLNGTKCTKQSTITIDAEAKTETTTSYKYTWSEKSYLEGWEFTGKTKTQTKSYTAGQK